MDFSEWVRVNRSANGWDLRALEARSGVDNSTIARIEKGRSQVTLVSAIRLWQAYNVPFSEFTSDLSISFSLDSMPKLANQKSRSHLVAADVCSFLKAGLNNEKVARGFVDNWIKRFNSFQLQKEKINPLQSIKSEMFWDISFEFPYPPDITAGDLSNIFESGKALTFVDAGHYLTLLRQNASMWLIDLEKETKISDTVLGRIERGSINNTKLKDLIQINNFLDKTGLFFGLYWLAGMQTIQLKEMIAKHSTRREAQRLWPAEQAAYNLILLQRWFRTEKQFFARFIADLKSLH